MKNRNETLESFHNSTFQVKTDVDVLHKNLPQNSTLPFPPYLAQTLSVSFG